MKLPTFRALRAKLTTSSDVAEALTTNAAQLASARGEMADLEAMRPGLLLNAEDSAVDAHEARLVDVRRLVARLEARSEALEVELAEVGAREAEAALTKRRIDAQTKADAARAWLHGRYAVIARELVEGIAAIQEAEAEAQRASTALAEAGQPGQVLGVECLTTFHRDEEGKTTYMSPNPSIVQHLRLPEIRTQYGEVVVPGFNDRELQFCL
ncbi:hypothetical protein P7D22_19565 [Lichenihabitans sp. Uapishka_5]|uniref:hypothetical protein n=1 Tax=Lichenihabitans sp. Uapishka_5 TaxID=3037302 RepID=UPI0029E7E8ED|nr:hypothetical protein [Lichenihabitans sp. Uapishka_5]MDX7953366.1 hypothetical protein [Lichenihabitans sp. Uapishka_5]